MNPQLLRLLACPVCKGPLEYREAENELVCLQDRIAFPVRDGVPVLLVMDARRLDRAESCALTEKQTGNEN